jgi:hypothetical protein
MYSDYAKQIMAQQGPKHALYSYETSVLRVQHHEER